MDRVVVRGCERTAKVLSQSDHAYPRKKLEEAREIW